MFAVHNLLVGFSLAVIEVSASQLSSLTFSLIKCNLSTDFRCQNWNHTCSWWNLTIGWWNIKMNWWNLSHANSWWNLVEFQSKLVEPLIGDI